MRFPTTNIPTKPGAKRLTDEQVAGTLLCIISDDGDRKFSIAGCTEIQESVNCEWVRFWFSEHEDDKPYQAAAIIKGGAVAQVFEMLTPKGSEYDINTDGGNVSTKIPMNDWILLSKEVMKHIPVKGANRPFKKPARTPVEKESVCLRCGMKKQVMLTGLCSVCTLEKDKEIRAEDHTKKNEKYLKPDDGDGHKDTKCPKLETVKEFVNSFKVPRIVVGRTLLIEITPGVGDWTAFSPHIFNKGTSPSGLKFPDGVGEHGRLNDMPELTAQALAAECQLYYDDLLSVYQQRNGSSILVPKAGTVEEVEERVGPLVFGQKPEVKTTRRAKK